MNSVINNENKAKFFALYWGQAVLWEPFIGQNVFVDQHFSWDLVGRAFYYLNLKPLSQISDEDVEEGYWHLYAYHIPVSAINIDYLRSKGYALPWMGLSVEELVDAGWVKLK